MRKLSRFILPVLMVMFWVFGFGSTPVSARYVDNRDGTVTDANTNLVWQKSEDAVARTWANASPYCDNLFLGGYADWRLPRVDELATLVDYAQYPALDPAFGTLRGAGFWSINFAASNPRTHAWFVDFLDGGVVPYFQSSVSYVRCVRGGPFWSFDPSERLSLLRLTRSEILSHGYVWQKADDGVPRNLQNAQSYCAALSLDGLDDWRLPSIAEMETIADYTTYGPSVQHEFLRTIQPRAFWSASTVSRFQTTIDMVDGRLGGCAP